MQKFEVRVYQEREAFFCIEANSKEEAENLFVSKMRDDDYFVDEVYETLEGGTINEEITAQPVQYDGDPDYTYEQMKERDE